jgi:hypothetical protein
MSINMPTNIGFTKSAFYLSANVQTFQSPLSGTIQRAVKAGSLWIARYSLPRMKRNDAVEWLSFFAQLEGRANTFNAFDPEGKELRGTGIGTPLVNGASQTGSSLVTDGWGANQIVLRTGDYFSVNSELKMVTEDILSDGSGNATINFKPFLRNSPTNNAPLIINNPVVEMFLSQDQIIIDTNHNGIYLPFTFTARESIA